MIMKLLVSPINVEEANICKIAGADIIDVKNPKEGSLGANKSYKRRGSEHLQDRGG